MFRISGLDTKTLSDCPSVRYLIGPYEKDFYSGYVILAPFKQRIWGIEDSFLDQTLQHDKNIHSYHEKYTSSLILIAIERVIRCSVTLRITHN